MNFRAWFFIFFVYVAYLLIGGLTFQAIECDESEIAKPKDPPRTYFAFFYNKMKDKLKETTNMTLPDCDRWSLYNSVFFSFTCMTTIGFGHLAPDTWQGKVFCIFYSLLGIPINGILIGYIASFFGSIPQRFKRKSPADESHLKSVLLLSLQVICYLVPGFVVFMALPAVIFWQIEEGWTYLDSLYFSFVTLTTIGFGDYVAGRDVNVLLKLGHWKIVYETGLIVWILFGLGYLVMIINIITDGITKPAKRAARKFAEAEKSMVEKILREIVNNKNKANCFDTRHMTDPSMASTQGSRYEVLLNDSKNLGLNFDENEEEFPSKPVSYGGDLRQTSESHDFEESHKGNGLNHTAVNVSLNDTGEDNYDPDDAIGDINHDTITSLRQFVKTASMMKSYLNVQTPTRLSDPDLTLRNRNCHSAHSSADYEPSFAETSFISQSSMSKLKHSFNSRRRVSDKHKGGSFHNSFSSDKGDKPRRSLRELVKGHSIDVINRLSNTSSQYSHQSSNNPEIFANVLRNTTVEEFIRAMSKVDIDIDEELT